MQHVKLLSALSIHGVLFSEPLQMLNVDNEIHGQIFGQDLQSTFWLHLEVFRGSYNMF